jgi:hypothetical protein
MIAASPLFAAEVIAIEAYCHRCVKASRWLVVVVERWGCLAKSFGADKKGRYTL